MNFKRIWSALIARNKEFYRDYPTLGWSLLFPFVVVLGFAFAFSGDSQGLYKVSIERCEAGSSCAALPSFEATKYIEWVDVTNLEETLPRLRRHQMDLIVSLKGAAPRYWINESSPKGYIVERILLGSAAEAGLKPERQTVQGKEIRYVDWLIAGMIAMNIMFGAFYGVGYTIVRYRKNGVLKRLRVTPITALEFMMAQILSRLVIIVAVSALVFFGTKALVGFEMHGSYLDLFWVLLIGTFSLISLSLVIAARTESEEVANGLLGMLTWPMMFLSGVWFSLEGAQDWVKKLATIFPLTHVIEAARSIMNEGATLAQVSGHLVILAAIAVVSLAVSTWMFRWR